MPRGPRIDAPGLAHHVWHRGVGGMDVFRDDTDREESRSPRRSCSSQARDACQAPHSSRVASRGHGCGSSEAGTGYQALIATGRRGLVAP
jgi:hypothetical protein